MNRRKSDVGNVGGEKINKKYDAKNVLGNVLECEECGATFRRRTERGKVVYRCVTRMEKGREACGESPTVEEEWLKAELGRKVCDGEYDEKIVKENVDKVKILKDKEIKLILK